VFLGDNLVSWSAKRQTVVSRSSAEAKYHAIANGVPEATWLRQLLHELQTPPSQCTLVYCDNISAVYLSTNLVQHERTKHSATSPRASPTLLTLTWSIACTSPCTGLSKQPRLGTIDLLPI
jgi:hypothetical protein